MTSNPYVKEGNQENLDTPGGPSTDIQKKENIGYHNNQLQEKVKWIRIIILKMKNLKIKIQEISEKVTILWEQKKIIIIQMLLNLIVLKIVKILKLLKIPNLIIIIQWIKVNLNKR